MSQKPTFVLVPGASFTPDVYDSVRALLAKNGYPTIAVSLPSVGASPPVTDMAPDVEAIRSHLVQLIEDEGKEVVLLLHSYSGLCGSDAAAGLGRKERAAGGLSGGITRLVYLMAYVQPNGWAWSRSGATYPDWMGVDTETNTATVTAENACAILYNDMPEAEGRRWAAKLQPQSLSVFSTATTHAAWQHIPSTYIMCTEDKAMPPPFVRMMIDDARKAQPAAFDVVETTAAGHSPFLSQPVWVAGVLERAAVATVGEMWS